MIQFLGLNLYTYRAQNRRLAYPSILLSPQLSERSRIRESIVTEYIDYAKSDKVYTFIITSKCYA
jgi:hypothetical protein